ncbi:hypothetical protein KY290_035932 [Solanum tuberosum]|uniref:Uncharacterized protein n=1 Tax=Solanum tuberosum TaxID=4113 RepID=A0ABQ7TRD5_SOLTU|nr:hypothetical protein KY285_035216 [Solanum tuberosum]KAH0737227.1 hypothetical protein KY290_035932 [Solanum tuberosum]
MLCILSGVSEGQETPYCLRRTNMLGGSSPPSQSSPQLLPATIHALFLTHLHLRRTIACVVSL